MFEELSRLSIDNNVERELDEAERLGVEEHHEVSATNFGEENKAIRLELELLIDQLDIKGLLNESIELVDNNPELEAKNKLNFQYIAWQPSRSCWDVSYQANKDVASSKVRAISGFSLMRSSTPDKKYIEWQQHSMSVFGGTRDATYRAQFLHILAYVPEVGGALQSPMLTILKEVERDKQGRMLYETLTADYFLTMEIINISNQRKSLDRMFNRQVSGGEHDEVDEQNQNKGLTLIMSNDEEGYRHVNELFAPSHTKNGLFFNREISGGKANEQAQALVTFSPIDIEIQRARIASAIEDFILDC